MLSRYTVSRGGSFGSEAAGARAPSEPSGWMGEGREGGAIHAEPPWRKDSTATRHG